MPRASGSGKRQSGGAGQQRDPKHDNGLVASNSKRALGRKNLLPSPSEGPALRPPVDPAFAGHAGPPLPAANHLHLHGQHPATNGLASLAASSRSSSSARAHGAGHHFDSASASASASASVSSAASASASAASSTPLETSIINRPAAGHGRRPSLGTYSEASSESCTSHIGLGHANGALVDGGSTTTTTTTHRQIDVNALKNADVHRDSGPIDMVATVLKSLPMQDTLAILIILMQLPSLSLSFIYVIFTCLTFVPPVTTSSGINLDFAEIFDGHYTMPSLVTILCMDCFFLLVWLFLWQPIQDTILDLAKPVIAITLGGGTASRDGGSSRGVTTCFAWVILSHLVRGTKAHWSRLMRQLPDDWHIPSSLSSSLEDAAAATTDDRRTTLAWMRSVLAIHILTQGLVRYIREWYLRREKANAAAGLNDPEAGKPPLSSTASASASAAAGDAAAHDAGLTFMTEADAGFAQALNSTSGNAATATATTTNVTNATNATAAAVTPNPACTNPSSMRQKRRKQSTQVRLQQPLWAALASTKIVVMKEYESSHVPSESQGTNATDIHNLGNAPFNTQPRQIWISYIGSDEVCFSTSHFPDFEDEGLHLQQTTTTADGQAITDTTNTTTTNTILRPAGVDKSKPFYVRVNNAFWQPTRILRSDDPSDDDGREGARWTGDIYGLRPSSKYVCEFVDSWTEKVLFSTSIRTVKELMKESKSGSIAVAEPQLSLQPDSPATTLRTSIAAAEARLADEKNRLKTWRKEWKSRINSLRKENELTDNQLLSAGSNDDKFKQKIRQQETQKAQAERDTERLADRLRSFDSAPEMADGIKKKTEKAYTAEKKLYDAGQRTFKEHKSGLENEVQAKEAEKANLNTRRNKIATRIAKVENELAVITDANNRGLNEVERRRQERDMWQERVAHVKNTYHDQHKLVSNANAARVEHMRSLQAQIHGFQTYLNAVNNAVPVDMGGGGSGGGGEHSHAGGFQQQHQQQQHHQQQQQHHQQLLQQLQQHNQQQQHQSTSHHAWNANPTGPTHFAPGHGMIWPNVAAAAAAPAAVGLPTNTHINELLPPVSLTPAQPGTSPWGPPPTAAAFEPRGSKARARSSSMLSDISGFTQSSREETRSPTRGAPRPLYTRRLGVNGSRGSSGGSALSGSGGGSGSGSGSGSLGEPGSPA